MTNIKVHACVVENTALTETIYRLRLRCESFAPAQPGQFVNVTIPGFFLRRPLAIADVVYEHDGGATLTLIVAQVGAGTQTLASVTPGTKIDVLGPLGHGFDVDGAGPTPVLVGGGSGIPPLYFAAKYAVARGYRPHVLLGFRTAHDVYAEQDFRELGCDVSVATEDGSYGVAGFVTAAMPDDASHVLACGPEGMLRSVVARSRGDVQVSLEAHMGCGFGACLGCTVQTVRGLERVCVEGPVFDSTDVIFGGEVVR